MLGNGEPPGDSVGVGSSEFSDAGTEEEREDMINMVPFPPRNLSKRVKRICLTGGPCGGKTTALSQVAGRLRSMGIQVFVVPESATTFSAAGAGFPVSGSGDMQLNWEISKLRMQMTLEDCFARVAQASRKTSVLLFDRGCMDTKAYCSAETWQEILSRLGKTERELCSERYDAIVHLVTAAEGAELYYTTMNNTARRETVEQARAIDELTRNAWQSHPRRRVVYNPPGVSGMPAKTQAVVNEVCQLLGVQSLRKERIRRWVCPELETQFSTGQMDRYRVFLDEFDMEIIFIESDTSRMVSYLRRCISRGGFVAGDTDVLTLCNVICGPTTPILSCRSPQPGGGPMDLQNSMRIPEVPHIDLGPGKRSSSSCCSASRPGPSPTSSVERGPDAQPPTEDFRWCPLDNFGAGKEGKLHSPECPPQHRPQQQQQPPTSPPRQQSSPLRSKSAFVSRFEEHLLKRQEYQQLLDQADPSCAPVRFRRRCFCYKDHWYQLDYFPQAPNGGLCYVDVEVHDTSEDVRYPKWLEGFLKEGASTSSSVMDFHIQSFQIARRLAEGLHPLGS
eukprot:Hpha_TRINITY_DN15899_c1_g2::TRINITY_DN15899_c1_g2_i1::g.190842::m.190842